MAKNMGNMADNPALAEADLQYWLSHIDICDGKTRKRSEFVHLVGDALKVGYAAYTPNQGVPGHVDVSFDACQPNPKSLQAESPSTLACPCISAGCELDLYGGTAKHGSKAQHAGSALEIDDSAMEDSMVCYLSADKQPGRFSLTPLIATFTRI